MKSIAIATKVLPNAVSISSSKKTIFLTYLSKKGQRFMSISKRKYETAVGKLLMNVGLSEDLSDTSLILISKTGYL